MLQADSHGDISSVGPDIDSAFANLAVSPPQDERLGILVDESSPQDTSITPPLLFSPRPGHMTAEIDMDATPTPQGQGYFDPEDETPRAT